ncbi:MAG: S8 family peptidase [Halioglobus sp.]|nr:S8 family peptidase [Halioglobus sp.]
MRDRISFTGAVFSLLFCLAVRAEEPRLLQVMLQGSSAAELAALVKRVGGDVTHELHIIDAVGATMTSAQLDRVLQSPFISRYIDDLAPSESPEEEEDDAPCRVRGHIELDFTPDGFRWELYNKREELAILESLKLSWPPALGQVESISIGGKELDSKLLRHAADGTVSVAFADARGPAIKDRSELHVRMAQPVVPVPRQSDFDLDVSFVAGCSDELVPGYVNNDGDYYYNSVSGVEALHRQGVTGRGVTVAVIDSGLWEHDALTRDTQGRNRVIGRYDALTDAVGGQVLDESGHGTHISSIIVNSESAMRDGKPTGTYKGVAPDASLVAVKVLDREGLAHLLDIVRAIQWVVDHRETLNIRVMNLSFAQTPRWPFWQDPVNQAAEQAWSNGIAVVAAAGNEGPEPGTVGSPGNLPTIITVGAVTDSWTPETRDDDYIPDFSSRGPTPSGHVKPDIVALGGHMTGLIRPESQLAQEQPEDILRTGEFVSTGSSQASALVSGILALLVQLEPELSPDQLKCKLITSAEPAINRDGTLAYSPFQQGHGYVMATRAVTLGRPECELPAARGGDSEPLLGPAEVADDGSATLPGLDGAMSATPSEKGMSNRRKWGVKDHIERLPRAAVLPEAAVSPIDWQTIYVEEKTAIGRLKGRGADQ